MRALPAIQIAESAEVASTAVVGSPFRRLLEGRYEVESATWIGDNVQVGHFCVVGAGARIGAQSVLDDYSKVECEAELGSAVLLIYRAQVCCDAQIGPNCVIGGFIGERSVLGARCRVFGSLVHAQRDRSRGWDEPGSDEPAPLLEEGVFVGFGAVVVGGVRVGRGVVIAANATVTKDIPAYSMVVGVNEVTPLSTWRGRGRNIDQMLADEAPREGG